MPLSTLVFYRLFSNAGSIEFRSTKFRSIEFQLIRRKRIRSFFFHGKRPVLSVRPKVAELAFHVFSRSLHPELYTIHQSRLVERTEYQARIDITNCGHVVTWNVPSSNSDNEDKLAATICEVATSAHQPLPKRRLLMSKPLKGSRTERANCRKGVGYRTHFQLESVGPDLFWMVGQQLSKGATEGLLHQFDASGRMALGALSYINIETRQKSMLIQAIHTFPDDYAIVKVESLFSIGDDASDDDCIV
ncbi:DUF2617 family protein [Rubripirellula obstinata]|uniref:DUF2617 family protein n=1 Tax=Rubripirellula obstinata TaxID=406547 RepID=UPI001F40D878|nr:DUF2617 family protein [Rubripirellula obstinata]